MAHFERRLRSVAQLCRNSRKGKGLDETRSAIPLVSSIEPKQNEDLSSKVTISKAVKDNLFTEAMQRLGDMTAEFGVNNEVLEIIDDGRLLLEPLSSTVFIGDSFVINMDNPQPRDALMAFDNTDKLHAAVKGDASFESIPRTLVPRSWSSNIHRDHHQQQQPSRHYIHILKALDKAFVHIVFSLLTGRPVIILGEPDKQRYTENAYHHFYLKERTSNSNNSLYPRSVQETVEALSLFVPSNAGLTDASIKSWYQDKVTEENLANTKLLGAQEKNLDASVYKLDICCVKIPATSSSLLLSPLYLEGTWVNQMHENLNVMPVRFSVSTQ